MNFEDLEKRLADVGHGNDPGLLLDGLCIEAHACLAARDLTAMKELANQAAEKSQVWLSRSESKPKDRNTIVWAWCAGQLRAVAAMLHAALLQRPLPMPVTQRPHDMKVLHALSGGDKSITQIAEYIAVDLSQTKKIVDVLEKEKYVRSVKHGRTRIASLTSYGVAATVPHLNAVSIGTDTGARTLSTPNTTASPAWMRR